MTGRQLAVSVALLGTLPVLAFLAPRATGHAQAASGQVTARVTGFCLVGPMRTGEWTRPGAVAVDPGVIPLYSNVAIEGLGDGFTALDTGGGVLGAHVDVWFPSCAEAINWGSKQREVWWSPP